MPPERRVPLIAVVVLALLGLAVLGLGGFILWQLRPVPLPVQPLALPAPQETPTPVFAATPPAPTPVGEDVALTPPPAPDPLPPALPALDDDQQAQAERIRQDVLELRGLPPQSELSLHLVDRAQLAAYARARYQDPTALALLERESRALQTLGLLPPGYDLAPSALNRRIHPAGALYDPAAGVVLVAGLRFGGIERWAYAAQLDRALLEDRYALSTLLDDPACQADPEPNAEMDTEACRALAALLAGDAALAAEQWAQRYASANDRREVLLYRAPPLALPAPLAPPYLAEDLTFYTQNGLRFARYLFNQGQWLGLDRVYRDPPLTSEQILHPRKYTEGEPALPVDPPAALPGEGWQVEWSSVLGEWTTYLLLSVPADPPAVLERDLAAAAAAGWGGDHYVVYYHPGRGQTALAAEWVWDSDADAQQFAAALGQQANARYPGRRLNPSPFSGADCWQGLAQISCVLSRPSNTLWFLAPDLETLQAFMALHP